MKFKLGDQVTAPGRIYRSRDRGTERRWYRPSWRQKPIEGIYIGRRTYANGTAEWDGEQIYFKPTDYVKVALIVTDTRSKPVPVLYDELAIKQMVEK